MAMPYKKNCARKGGASIGVKGGHPVGAIPPSLVDTLRAVRSEPGSTSGALQNNRDQKRHQQAPRCGEGEEMNQKTLPTN